MLAFICYFFPAIMSVWLFEVITKNDLNLKQFVLRFCTNSLIINFFCVGAKSLILGTGNVPIFDGKDMIPKVAFNYLIMAIAVSIVLIVIESLMFKKVKIAVEEENDEAK